MEGSGQPAAQAGQEAFATFASALEDDEDALKAVADLESRRGCNSDLLILLCWLAASGRGGVDHDEISTLLDTADHWRRNVSRRFPEMVSQAQDLSLLLPPAVLASFLHDTTALEQSARRIERSLLLDAVAERRPKDGDLAQRAVALAASLTAYFGALEISAVPRDRIMAASLIRFVVPDLAADKLAALAQLKSLAGDGRSIFQHEVNWIR